MEGIQHDAGEGKFGSLLKLEAGMVGKAYKSFWFEIVANQLSRELLQHTSESKKDIKGRVNCDEVVALHSYSSSKAKTGFFSSTKGPADELRFEVVCSDRVIELAAATRQEKRDWLGALSKACDMDIKDETAELFALTGILLKCSGGGKRSKTWTTRFFTLQNEGPSPVLRYFAAEGDVKEKGNVPLSDVIDLRAWSVADGTDTPPIASRYTAVALLNALRCTLRSPPPPYGDVCTSVSNHSGLKS